MAIQDEAHRLVTEAAEMRTWASAELRAVVREIEEAAGLPPLDIRYASARPDTSLVKASALRGRMDGLFHSSYHEEALVLLRRLPEDRRAFVGELASRVFLAVHVQTDSSRRSSLWRTFLRYFRAHASRSRRQLYSVKTYTRDLKNSSWMRRPY